MSQRLWVLDVDGTLMTNIHDYSYPILDSTRLMIDALSDKAPDVVTIIRLQDEIDKKRIREINPVTGKPYLFSMERFPDSRVATYEELCQRESVTPDEEVRRKLREIGYRAFDERRYQHNIKSDAVAFTTRLNQLGDVVVLLTKGDARVQDLKVRALYDAGVYYDAAVIVEDSKATHFAQLYESWRDHVSCAFSVGDSYESDIAPALQCGYRGVWIPIVHWEQRDKMPELRERAKADGVVEARELSDILSRIEV